MTDKLTQIRLPGGHGAGIAEYGEETAEQMIAKYRRFAERQKLDADEILAAADNDFLIEIVRGVHVQHPVRMLQRGRVKPEQSA